MKLEARYIFIYMWFFPGQALPSTPVGQPSPEQGKHFWQPFQEISYCIDAIKKQSAIELPNQDFIVIKKQTNRKPGFGAARILASLTELSTDIPQFPGLPCKIQGPEFSSQLHVALERKRQAGRGWRSREARSMLLDLCCRSCNPRAPFIPWSV